MLRSLSCLLALASMPLAGCYNPNPLDGGFLCRPETKRCPSGFNCVQEGAAWVCRKEGVLPGDGPPPDRPADLPVRDRAVDLQADAPRVDARVDLKADSKPDAKVDLEIDAKVDSKVDARLDVKPDAKPDNSAPDLPICADTGPCDDGQDCTHSDTCTGGVCKGTPYSCDDSKDCTDDICTGSPGIAGCMNPLKAGRCLIAGSCQIAGAKNPGLPFLQCQPGSTPGSTSSWTLSGKVTTLAGTSIPVTDAGLSTAGFFDNCTALDARFNQLTALALDGSAFYLADIANYRIRKLESSWVSTLVGMGSAGFTDGKASSAQVYQVGGVATGQGRVYFTDNSTSKSLVRYYDKAKDEVFTLTGSSKGSADGSLASATFNGLIGIAVDGAGVIYVADAGNRKIRRIDPAASVDQVTTFAGAGGQGFQNGAAAGATFTYVYDLALGASGELYVLEEGDPSSTPAASCVRRIAGGMVTTFAGVCGSQGYLDGPAASAKFHVPRGIAVGTLGEVYVADSKNQRIRAIWNNGGAWEVTTLAGDGVSATVDGPLAGSQVTSPQGIEVDSFGNLYFAERYGNRLRVISP